MIGQALGHYQIEARLGAGGMGVVYLAFDTKLQRRVAIKVLSGAPEEARKRVLREARAASAHNHPNICTIHEVQEAGAQTFIVMEHVPGGSLRERIRPGGLPVDTVVRYGIQIADALAHAHDRGIVHCDLKSSNILVAADGRLKVSDFGLAARVAVQDSEDTTSSQDSPTTYGGTLPYMSPEVLVSKSVDPRTDIWALGIVLYELADGRRPFNGRTPYELTAAILHEALPALQAKVPHALRGVIQRCLAKQREERYQRASEVRAALETVVEPFESTVSPPLGAIPDLSRARQTSRWWILGLTPLAIALIAGVIALPGRNRSRASESLTLSEVVTWPSAESNSRISPDGRWVSFLSNRDGEPRVFVHNLQSGASRRLDAPAGVIVSHAWSPDGQEFALLVRRGPEQLLEIAPAFFGGAPRLSVSIPPPARIVRWVGGAIFVEQREVLLRVDASSGASQPVPQQEVPGLMTRRQYDVSADGRKLVFSALRDGNEDLWLADLAGGAPVQLTNDAFTDSHPVWADAAGTTLFFQSSREGQLDVWRLSLATRSASRVTVGSDEDVPDDAAFGGQMLALSESSARAEIWVLETGSRRAWQITSESLQDLWPSLAPAGRRVAFQRRRRTLDQAYLEGEAEIVIARWDGRSLSSGTVAVRAGFAPHLSPDARWLAFLGSSAKGPDFTSLHLHDVETQRTWMLSDRYLVPGLYLVPIDWAAVSLLWSRDAAQLLFCDRSDAGVSRIRRWLPGHGDGPATVIEASDAKDRFRDLWLSDDGKRLVYVRHAPGVSEVRERDLQGGRERVLLLDRHGVQARLMLKGWHGEELVAVRARATGAGTQALEILAIGRERGARLLGTAPQAYGHTARLAAASDSLFLTMREGSADNLFAFSFKDSRFTRLTDNQRPSVTFSGIVVAESGALIHARHELKNDIWLLRQGGDRR